MISGNMVGSYSQMGKTFILQDENGNEITGVVVSQETMFTASDNDVREGMVYAGDDGVSTGTKDISIYRTTAGFRGILPGKSFSIPLSVFDKYDYTKLQCIITPLNTNYNDSTSAEKVVIGDSVYNVGSTVKLSDVVKNSEQKSIDLNIENNTNINYYIRYFTYREEE